MDRAQLIRYVKEWLTLESELATLRSEMKKRRDEKKAISDKLIYVMKENDIDCLDTQDGKLLYSQNKVKQAITKKNLSTILAEYYKNDDDKANNLFDFIMEKQEVKIKDNIRLKGEKKNTQ